MEAFNDIKLNKISFLRTGGQSGVDRAVLDFAKSNNIGIVGWCPKNGWAEDMPTSPGILTYYPELKETPSCDVSQRTMWNVRDSHATLIISPDNLVSKGTYLTGDYANEIGRPLLYFNPSENINKIVKWLNSFGNELTLNIGGPRLSEWPQGYTITIEI